jgi:dGTPase
MDGVTYDEADRARLVDEPDHRKGRTAFQRDRARVLHSGALRRLAGKTQVVEPGSTSVPRTRLTHSLECAQIGREMGLSLGCDADLVDAATKYPWPKRAGTSKYGVYDDDLEVFAWIRSGAPEGRRCLETQVMDWADDVAYSVHDLEDGVVAGLIDLARLREAGERATVAELAARHYSPAGAAALEAAFDALVAEPWWPTAYDGTAGAQVALKEATSALIGRFCRAAEHATRDRYGDASLSRYDADLVVPEAVRLECAALKAVTACYVMDRPGVRAVQERERAVVVRLVELLTEQADLLEPVHAEAWRAAADDAGRLRAVVDQVAGLTDGAAAALHARLG